jgi:hypothetical protein
MSHSPEPWKVEPERSCLPWNGVYHTVDANGCEIQLAVTFGNMMQDHAQWQRIAACVNFCQHMSTELLQGLTEAHIGAATLAQWVRRNATFEEDGQVICNHCDHEVRTNCPTGEGGHEEGCLLEKCLELMKEHSL